MKTIIAGSRGIKDYLIVEQAIKESGFKITEVVSGGANGVDKLGVKWAERHGIPVKHFPANWDKHGKAAGPIRNAEMAKYANAAVIVWDGESRGTANMIEEAKTKGLQGFVYNIKYYYDKEATEKDNSRISQARKMSDKGESKSHF